MTGLSNSFTVGDIWLAYVRYDDHPETGKVRPVVVIGSSNGIISVLKVTTKTTMAQHGGILVELHDWKSSGLLKPSYVRVDLVLDMDTSQLLNDSPLGRLSEKDSLRIRNVLLG